MKGLFIRLTTGLFNKLKEYAKENEITVTAAIRLILIQFFKEKK